MDSEGNIYIFKNHPDPETFIKDYDLVEIPEEELPVVANLSTKEKKEWYNSRKAAVQRKGAIQDSTGF